MFFAPALVMRIQTKVCKKKKEQLLAKSQECFTM